MKRVLFAVMLLTACSPPEGEEGKARTTAAIISPQVSHSASARQGVVKPADAVSLKPQPEPLGRMHSPTHHAKAAKPGEAFTLNPRPEPPGKPAIGATAR